MSGQVSGDPLIRSQPWALPVYIEIAIKWRLRLQDVKEADDTRHVRPSNPVDPVGINGAIRCQETQTEGTGEIAGRRQEVSGSRTRTCGSMGEPKKNRALRTEVVNLVETVEVCHLDCPGEKLFLGSRRRFTIEGILKKGCKHDEILPPI
ncbi:hypothetical protein TIFTF001_005755 [Ficus carica]|uniref:Uncharacterized protein n=1 Tax=Ficus carica TaxID=3494 RepID=A0AA88A2F4_FICCA|nr:hypothetical protein TIFTF001_005755 [Ficus carica]